MKSFSIVFGKVAKIKYAQTKVILFYYEFVSRESEKNSSLYWI